MNITLAKRIAASVVASCLAAQPAFAALTDISNTPLGSAAGGFLPNLLFILDDSGSMASDYNPDYVNDNNTCMANSSNGTACQRGDPPYEAGGATGFNGVGYDPNFTYQPGLTATGQPVINPTATPPGTLNVSSTTQDAYLSGANVDLTSKITDKRFCNPNGLCKRNGQDDSTGLLVSGTDASGHALSAGQLPYRTHAPNSSTLIFGLPEMMPAGTFVRNNSATGGFVGSPTSLVRVTTVEPHGLSTGDAIYTTTSNVAATCATVTKLDNNNFTYNSSGTTTQGRAGTYRKCATGSFSRSSGTITVSSTAHGLVSGDVITAFVASNTGLNATNVPVSVSSVDTFTYSAGSGSVSATSGLWVRSGLYNAVSTVTGPAIAYRISPIEWCTDVNLTNCKEIYPPVVPPATPTGANAAYSNPAYVRFCKTQADALAPGSVSGTSVPIPQTSPASPITARCQLKFVNQTGLTNYIFPRFGWFNRDTIVNTGITFKNRPSRNDCVTSGVKPDCTYTEEIQNYAKWFAYYRTRMQMMKTSAGRAFLPFISNPTTTPPKPDRLRVGFITINPTNRNSDNQSTAPNVDASKYLRIDTFNNVAPTTQAINWYNKFYSIIPNNSTPLRLALSRAGWIYAGKLNTGLTAGIPATDDPIQVSCQKNYAFLTTDGFWNQGVGKDLANNDLGNQDNKDGDSAFAATPNPYVPPQSGTTADIFVSRATGTFDGATSTTVAGTTPGGVGTLADIAMYYYRTDLRGGTDLAGNPTGPATSPSTSPSGGDVSINNVTPAGTFDFALHQHMTTFSIGLADGLMRYQADYATNPNSDFFRIVNADIGCFWSGLNSTCNWPLPVADGQSALDDLWHAAVNGRGSFYSAVNPAALATGLSSALNALGISVASAAAAATSSPQVAQGNALAFSTTYQTSTWSGEIYAQRILSTGEVDTSGPNNGKLWEGQKLLVKRVGNPAASPPILPDPSPRVIKTFDVDPASLTKLKNFQFTSLSSTLPAGPNASEQAQFVNHCASTTPATPQLSQCPSLNPLQLIPANDGPSMVDFLNGIPTNEGGAFRDRTEQDASGAFVQTVLGDIINSQPQTVGAPFFLYENEGTNHAYPKTPVDYAAFKQSLSTRAPFVLVGANDGFLHSFDQATGQENWAYVPRFLMPSLYQLADKNYPGQHRFFVDGSPEVTDVFDVNANVWKTIVIGGMNSGGRGVYALDITDPLNPKGLWEFCADSNWCPSNAVGPHSDPDLGFSYGNPVIGRRDTDGRWVVVLTSGLNNVNPGDGKGYLYVLDAITGQILHKIRADDGTGSTTSPSGLMKMGAYYPIGLDDPNFTHVYASDQKGHVWRVDMSTLPSKRGFSGSMVAYTGPSDITIDTHFIGLLANLQDGTGRPQPLTARPAGTHLGTDPFNPSARIYYVGTGRYIGNSDLSDQGTPNVAWQQSIYGIRDQLDNAKDPWNGSFVPSVNFRFNGGKVVEQKLGQSGLNRTITKNPIDWTSQDGFFIDLNPHFPGDPPEGNSPGERVFLDVRLILGTLLITSNVPAKGGACVPGGSSFQYNLDFKTGGYVGNDATAIAGHYIKDFLVGVAIEQAADGTVKGLNKTLPGENVTTDVQTDTSFQGKRFSFRER